MASSWISNLRLVSGCGQGQPSAPAADDSLEELRHRGWKGGRISPHRAFARLHLRRRDGVTSMALVVVFSTAWVLLLPVVGGVWGGIFRFWARWMQLPADIIMVPQQWAGHIRFALPYVNVSAGASDPETWWTTAGVTIAAVLTSFFISRELLPWIYLIRFLAIIQATALGYFAFAAARFPHDLASYTVGMLVFGAILTGLLPIILGFTFYLFDFRFTQKLVLTLMAMGHLTLFIPCQYMLHAYLLHQSILFMPVLYFAFGPFLDVLIFISFYSWGMSWQSRQSALSA